jgi:endonuclease YncB( thermonuclease family)
MSVVKFEPKRRNPWARKSPTVQPKRQNPWARNSPPLQQRSRYSTPWLYRRTRFFGLTRYRIIKDSFILGGVALLFAGSFFKWSIDTKAPILVSAIAPSITVVDGDTVRANGQVYRLLGFDTPESGALARCERERKLADAATNRLRQLVANGQSTLEPITCSCPSGTEGTLQCNYGRLCARLRADGRDVGTVLISEGLARPYVCSQNSCPRRQSWCS